MATKFPATGLDHNTVLAQLDAASAEDVNWRDGRLGLYVHFGGEDVLAVAEAAYLRFFSKNALGPSAFPSLATFEHDVVAWTAHLLRGDSNASGNITSGGTESIFLALKAIRDWARDVKNISGPTHIVVPYSAHPAFNKAAHLLGMRITRVPVGSDFRAMPQDMARAVTANTVGIVASAPGFPQGVVDPIEAIAAVAREHDLWMHVDACVGGFILPFARKLGYPIPDFDFAVDGVQSISADLHKYGFAAKGASAIIYRDAQRHAYQTYRFNDWPLGEYATPTLAGTRPGGALAAAWAVIRYLGETGYLQIVKEIMATRDTLIAGIDSIEGLHVIANPEGPIVTYGAEGLDVHALGNAMRERGWFVTIGERPICIHLGMLTVIHVPAAQRYLSDLEAAVCDLRLGHKTSSVTGPRYGS